MKLSLFQISDDRHLRAIAADRQLRDWASREGRLWLDVEHPNTQELRPFLEPLQLHPLVLEACLERTDTAWVVPFESALLMELPIHTNSGSQPPPHLTIVCLQDMMLTIHDPQIPAISGLAADLRASMRLLRSDISSLLYHLLDRLVDENLSLVAIARRRINQLDRRMYEDQDEFDPDLLRNEQQNVADLTAVCEDQLRCVASLQTIESGVFDIAGMREYYRDVVSHLDHCMRSNARLELRLSEIYQQHHLRLQDRTDSRLRVLTILSAVFLPLTLITGIYGMNFEHMPELSWSYSYPFAIGSMIAIAAAMLVIFYRRGWFG